MLEKNRNGTTGDCQLQFDGATMTFTDYDDPWEAPADGVPETRPTNGAATTNRGA